MDLTDRVLLLMVGGVIGFILGYIVRSLREIKEELDEVDDLVKKQQHGDEGFMQVRIVADVMMLVVLCLTVYAAVVSGIAAEESRDSQDQLEKVTDCNTEFQSKTITALNERTTYSTEAAAANVELQKAQAAYVEIFDDVPPPTREEGLEAFRTYFEALNDYIDLSTRSKNKIEDFPYPTAEDFKECLAEE